MKNIGLWRQLKFFGLMACLFVFADGLAQAASPGGQDAEREAESLLSQAQTYFERGAYSEAVQSYLEAVRLSQNKRTLSQASLGLSLGYFYLRDMPNAEKWLRRVLEFDPQKEISNLFYPSEFVRLFSRVKNQAPERRPGESYAPGEMGDIRTDGREDNREGARSQIHQGKNPAGAQIMGGAVSNEGFLGERDWRDKWEIETHYSIWSVNPIKGLFEADLKDEVAEEIRNEMTKQIGGSHSGLEKAGHEQSFVLDSEGHNYGVGIRFYPGGRGGAFSLGFSLEKNRMKILLKGGVRQNFANGTYAKVDADAYLEIKPLVTHMSLRWDIAPSWKVTPYFALGLGVAALNGRLGYSYTGRYVWGGPEDSIEETKDKTLDEAEEDGDFNIPNILPFFQMGIGLRGEIVKGLSVRIEGSFWNGVVARAGLAYRF